MMNSQIIDDPTNPYYLHHGDSSSNILVSQPLTRENYNAWKRAMTIALNVKNKLRFVTGVMHKPLPSNAMDVRWNKCNMLVLSWLANSLSKEIANSVLYIDLAKELWNELKEKYSESNEPRVFQLQRSISSLNQGQLNVNAYFTKLKSLWDELMNLEPQPICKCDPTCNYSVLKTLMDYHH